MVKDPDSEEPFGRNWAPWLAELGAGVTLTSSTWLAEPDGELVLADQTIMPGNLMTFVRLKAGVEGTTYQLTNRVVASDGSKDDRTTAIYVMQQ